MKRPLPEWKALKSLAREQLSGEEQARAEKQLAETMAGTEKELSPREWRELRARTRRALQRCS